jgi:hypothetical protein
MQKYGQRDVIRFGGINGGEEVPHALKLSQGIGISGQ